MYIITEVSAREHKDDPTVNVAVDHNDSESSTDAIASTEFSCSRRHDATREGESTNFESMGWKAGLRRDNAFLDVFCIEPEGSEEESSSCLQQTMYWMMASDLASDKKDELGHSMHDSIFTSMREGSRKRGNTHCA